MKQDRNYHAIKGLLPAMRVMECRGYTKNQCLENTGLTESSLNNTEQLISTETEMHFYQNLCNLDPDPGLGLAIGKEYDPAIYGMLGYAILSAPTLRAAAKITGQYGKLTFTHFTIRFREINRNNRTLLTLSFEEGKTIPEELKYFFYNREMSAALTAFAEISQFSKPFGAMVFPKNLSMHKKIYEKFFDCPVNFEKNQCYAIFDQKLIDKKLERGDEITNRLCEEQCKRMLESMEKNDSLVDQIRQILLSSPGAPPSLEITAEKLSLSSRTLKRKLQKLNINYQNILNEIRYELAKEYLQETTLPLAEISNLLGYSDPSNFTHAFKRWHGESPNQYRNNFK